MTMITPSYLGETIEYSSLHACRSTLEDPTITSRVVEQQCGLVTVVVVSRRSRIDHAPNQHQGTHGFDGILRLCTMQHYLDDRGLRRRQSVMTNTNKQQQHAVRRKTNKTSFAHACLFACFTDDDIDKEQVVRRWQSQPLQ